MTMFLLSEPSFQRRGRQSSGTTSKKQNIILEGSPKTNAPCVISMGVGKENEPEELKPGKNRLSESGGLTGDYLLSE